jgi:hypothetical protein
MPLLKSPVPAPSFSSKEGVGQYRTMVCVSTSLCTRPIITWNWCQFRYTIVYILRCLRVSVVYLILLSSSIERPVWTDSKTGPDQSEPVTDRAGLHRLVDRD